MRLRRSIVGDVKRSDSYRQSPPRPPRKVSIRRFFDKLLNVLLLMAIGAALIYCILLTGSPKVEVDAQVYRPLANYQSAVLRDSNFFHKTKVTYSGDTVANNLQERFPEIISSDIRLSPFSTSPVIKLTLSPPSLIMNSAGATYLVDGEGVAVISTTNAYAHNVVNLYTVEDQSGLVLKPGLKVLSKSNVLFITQIIAQAKSAKVPVASLTLPPLSQELDLKTTDQPYLVKFYLGGDPVLQSGQFLAARHSFAQKNIHPSKYLDVRVAGKVFFK